MIQEKDFLYRVPVKNALVTAPGKQVRNPEILVDLEGGEFMHGNILDANSTNKLIDQSVKDAIDNNIENGNYVTRDLLEAETSARLSNYVLTTALNQQIDTLNAAISAKQDAGDYALKSDIPEINTIDFVSKTATDTQIIKSDLDLRQGLFVKNSNLFTDYTSILYSGITIDGTSSYIYISASSDYTGETTKEAGIKVSDSSYRDMYTFLNQNHITINNKTDNKAERIFISTDLISSRKLDESRPGGFGDDLFILNENGVRILNGDNNHVLTSDASTIDITQYALKTELPTVPTNVSQLTNDSNFITQQDADAKYALANSLNTVNDSVSSLRVGLSKKQDKITVNSVDIADIETADITKLRTIVINLIDALSTSGLIRQNSNLE